MATAKKVAQEQSVSFDQEGNIVVNKDSSISPKLMARRAIEAHLEKKQLEQNLESYYAD